METEVSSIESNNSKSDSKAPRVRLEINESHSNNDSEEKLTTGSECSSNMKNSLSGEMIRPKRVTLYGDNVCSFSILLL